MNIVRYSYPSYRTLASYPGRFSRSPWTSLESEIDRLFAASVATESVRAFPVDLYEDPSNAYVRAELPGVNRDEISVEMSEGELTITAVRKSQVIEGQAPSAGTDQAQQSSTLSRSLTIPAEVSADQVSAAYENGVLTVTLPKRVEAKPKKITVEVN